MKRNTVKGRQENQCMKHNPDVHWGKVILRSCTVPLETGEHYSEYPGKECIERRRRDIRQQDFSLMGVRLAGHRQEKECS